MSVLWVILVAMTALLIGAVYWPASRASRLSPNGDQPSSDAVVSVYRDRLAELELEYQQQRVDKAQYEALRTELHKNLLAEVDEQAPGQSEVQPNSPLEGRVLLLVALVVPLSGLAYYYTNGLSGRATEWLQTRAEYSTIADRARRNPSEVPAIEPAQAMDFVRVLANDIAHDGMNSATDLYVLGALLLELNVVDQALNLLDRSYRIDPHGDAIKLALAQARIMTNGGRLDPLSGQLLRQVIDRDPGHRGALMLLGFAAFNDGRPEVALTAWRPLLASLPADSEPARLLQRNIDQAEQQLQGRERSSAVAGDTAAGPPVADAAERPASGAGPSITVNIDLSEELLAQLDTNASLFVFARALEGPPMPVAAAREPAQGFPIQVVLDDNRAMTPQLKLSNFEQVVVGARISHGGGPIAKSGDWEAATQTVALSGEAAEISLIVDRVID